MSAPNITPSTTSYLPEGLPIPVPEPDGLSAPYWAGLREGKASGHETDRGGDEQNCLQMMHKAFP